MDGGGLFCDFLDFLCKFCVISHVGTPKVCVPFAYRSASVLTEFL